MANTHTTLASLFSDIADAIREKTGETGTMVADNFPEEIKNIKSGTQVWVETGAISSFNHYYGVTITTANSDPKRILGAGVKDYTRIGTFHYMILNGTTATIGSADEGEETVNVVFGTNSVKIPNSPSYIAMDATVNYRITNAEI